MVSDALCLELNNLNRYVYYSQYNQKLLQMIQVESAKKEKEFMAMCFPDRL